MDDEALLKLAREVSAAGRVTVTKNAPREWFGSVEYSQFAGSVGFVLHQKTKPKKYEFALSILRRQLYEMIFDYATAVEVGAPLAALGEPDFFRADPQRTTPTVDDVAMRVFVPVLQGMTTQEFIRLREMEYDHFKKFQTLLEEAIEETIGELQGGSPDEAAQRVWERKIRPQLVDLEQRIASSRRALTRKLMAGVSVGAASVGVGTIAGALIGSVGGPLGAAIGTAVGGVALGPTVLPFITKHLDEKQEFERDGTYFLWKAENVNRHD